MGALSAGLLSNPRLVPDSINGSNVHFELGVRGMQLMQELMGSRPAQRSETSFSAATAELPTPRALRN